MAIHCPECGEEIDYLKAFRRAEKSYHIYQSRGELDWDYVDTYEDDASETDFECPECGELLFHDEEQVIKFLQWGDLYPWKGVDDYGQKDKQ